MSSALFLHSQESLAQDRFAKNGHGKELHIVAKNIAFTVHLGSNIDLNIYPLSASLLYDFEENQEHKEVDAVKVVPLEYIAHITDDGDKAAIEAKIGVLSSQHQGAFFRIRFSATDRSTNTLHQAFTHPIKVISKRNQVRKMMAKRELVTAGLDSNTNTPPTPQTSMPSPKTSTPSPKKPKITPTNDSISETLLRLQAQQQEQALMIKSLLLQREEIKEPSPVEHKEVSLDFETAFRGFLQALKEIPVKDRNSRIRRVLQNTSEEDSQNFHQFVDTSHLALHDTNMFGLSESPNMFEAGTFGFKCGNWSCSGDCEDQKHEHEHEHERANLEELFNQLITDPLASPELEQY